jgi:hypothetical protein
LAGQPQEPWQSYSPPSADNHDTYTYPPPGAQVYGQQAAAARPAAGYQSPSYAVQDQGFPGQPAQDQAAGYQGPHGQDAPWQEAPGAQAATRVARPRSDAKGFFGALFDFSFNSFVTPKIIKALYALYTVWMLVWAIIFLRIGFKFGGGWGGISVLVIVDPIFLLLTLGAFRVVLELFMVVHRLHDDVRAIRARSDERL